MIYSIEILPSAQREWKKLDPEIKRQAVRKLESLVAEPRVPSAKLAGMPDCYKIKLRSKGFRIVYQLIDRRLVILAIAAAKRDARKKDVYDAAMRRVAEIASREP
jgi:mRNA interferase RelE/StbE